MWYSLVLLVSRNKHFKQAVWIASAGAKEWPKTQTYRNKIQTYAGTEGIHVARPSHIRAKSLPCAVSTPHIRNSLGRSATVVRAELLSPNETRHKGANMAHCLRHVLGVLFKRTSLTGVREASFKSPLNIENLYGAGPEAIADSPQVKNDHLQLSIKIYAD